MEESEVAVELKKACSEMILNVSKEAAARVMDAERRASSFRRDLFCAKEESVRMLVRLKRMLDARLLEMETTASKKEEQIAVLEAQMEESESKMLDLRMELEIVRDEMKMKNTKNTVLCSKENESSSIGDLPENHFDCFEPIVPYYSDSERENARNLDKERLVTGVGTVQRICNETKPVVQLADPGLEGSDDHKTDFAAIITGRKEPKQFRNGCTESVQAFEGHLLEGTCGCELDCGSQYKGENKTLPVSPSQNLEIGKMVPLSELERPAVTRKKHRKTTLSKKSKSTEIPVYANQWRRQHVVFSLPLAKSYSTNDSSEDDRDFLTSQIKNDDNDGVLDCTVNLQKSLQRGDNCTIEFKAVKYKGRRKARGRKNIINTFQLLSDLHCRGKSVEMNTIPKELDEAVISKEKSEGLSVCNLVVKKRDFVNVHSMSVKCEHDAAANNVLVPYEESEPESNSVNSAVNAGRNVLEDGRSVRSDDSRLVKYTFQRKRKRASSSDVGKSDGGRGNTVKKQAGDTLKVKPLIKGCKPMDGSPRDSRQLTQVARQLIALSGRRW